MSIFSGSFEEFFDDALDVFADVVEAGSVSMIDKAIAARASGDRNPVSALGEVVASVFDVDLDDVCDTSYTAADAGEFAEASDSTAEVAGPEDVRSESVLGVAAVDISGSDATATAERSGSDAKAAAEISGSDAEEAEQ